MVAADAAGSWRGSARVSTNFIWSDNLFLSNSGPESGAVVQIFPSISASRPGNRVQASINYGPSALIYPSDSELNNIQHVGQASLRTEPIERYFFLDFTARANQQLVNPRVNSGFDAVGNPNAFDQVASFEIRPRFRLPVFDGRFATVRFDPGIGAVARWSTDNRRDGASTGVSDSTLSINSGPWFNRVPWSLTWRRRVFDTDTGEGWGNFSSRVGYIFSSKYRADLTLGYDAADLTGTDQEDRGVRWEISLRWTPKRTTSFEFGTGDAFYGNTYRLNASHRHKRWALNARYRITIETFASEIFEQQVVPLEDEFGDPIPDPITGEGVLATVVTTPIRRDETFLRDQLNLSAAYSKGRNTARLSWSVTRRDYSESDLDTLDNDMRVTFTRRLSQRLSASAELRLLRHEEEQTDAFDYFQHGINFGTSYQLGPRSSFSGRIARQARDGSRARGGFSEHRASFSFNYRF
jgi:uncharacterized protein (PEP-CTERM system associated)